MRHHPHHGMRPPVQGDQPTEQVLVGSEVRAPECIRYHRDRGSLGESLLLREPAAPSRLDTQGCKELRCHYTHADPPRSAGIAQVQAARRIGRNTSEDVLESPGIGDVGAWAVHVSTQVKPDADVVQEDESVRFGERQRPKQHRIRHAEDHRIRADPQSERDYRHRGEGRGASQ